MITSLKNSAHHLAAYAGLMYYFEIIYVMIALLFLLGKPVAVLTGMSLCVLLSIQIIGIYQKKETHRKIQVFLMDFHCAYAVSFLLSTAIFGFTGTAYDAAFLVVRTILAAFELPAIFLLTDEVVMSDFAKS